MTLPPFVRNLAADLIGRRLWPVALALVVALVAVPVLIKSGGSEPVAVTAGVPVPNGPGAAAVTLADNDVRANGGGALRDPFTTPPSTGGASTAAGGAGAATGGASAGGSGVPAPAGASGGGGGGFGDVAPGSVPGLDDVDVVPVGGGTGSGPSPGPGASANGGDKDSWHVDLRFGQDGKLGTRADVPRLSPLPSADDPFFVFLGVLADGETAMFLVSSDAEATGDGKCLPSPQSCERVTMKAGDTQFFDVTTPAGTSKQYQLELVRVDRRTQASAAVAAEARTRESDRGRQVLRTAVDTGQVEVSDLAFSRELGLVLPSGNEAAKASSTLFGGFRVDLRFGAPGALVKRYNLARLTPLPSVEEPTFVYLGVLGDGETALFLNPTEAAASGDAVCRPTPEECQRVELKAGQQGVFAAPTMDGTTEEYALTVDDIARLEATTPEEAEAGIRRESPAGRIILRRLITEVGSLVGDLGFSGKSGTLEPVPPAAPAEAEAAPEAPASITGG